MPLFNNTQVSVSPLPLCPVKMLPDILVSRDDPLLGISDMVISDLMRSRYSAEQLKELLLALHVLGGQRDQFGDRAALGLGGARGYQYPGTAGSAMDWLHDHELKRAHQIQLSLPTQGEECAAARSRIAARIAARKTKRL